MANFFGERETVVHLLGVAVQSKLVSHTAFMAIPQWMKLLNPNLCTQSAGSHIGVFDIWPEDHAPTGDEMDAFAAAARGWVSFCVGKGDGSTELAIRRTAAFLGIARGRFGTEDRIIDASVALEAMYSHRASRQETRGGNVHAAEDQGVTQARNKDAQDDLALHRPGDHGGRKARCAGGEGSAPERAQAHDGVGLGADGAESAMAPNRYIGAIGRQEMPGLRRGAGHAVLAMC